MCQLSTFCEAAAASQDIRGINYFLLATIFISVRASDADLWDTFVMSEEEELWFSLFSLENLATKC